MVPMEILSEEKGDLFEDFLSRKNIHGHAFGTAEPALYASWKMQFMQMHEESFVMQNKFYLNPIRRKYPKVQYQR